MLPICPNCKDRTIQRVHGIWCARCRGWYVSYVHNGEFKPFIRIHTYLP